MDKVFTDTKEKQVFYRENKDSLEIPGRVLPVYINNEGYSLGELKIYKNGLIDASWLKLVDIDGLSRLIDDGWVVTGLPEGAQVYIDHFGHFKAYNVNNYVKSAEFIKEVKDVISALNDLPTSSEICVMKYEKYRKNPDDISKEALRIAYYNVPEYLRQYLLGDMDIKDRSILEAIS